ncbi:PH domain-containing protein [Winogradskyella sp. UBA3174]|uniref:PH domain-containing protein n=1 Tax=Winogradskyella sp. UBA3174 TaxID=1947785 RepID=UPI0025F1B45E|nr:PH domain-containing protein [Winogradskyella sp. UBA3174]|tara:strand:- start:28855 stop:30348 length:1494 start_codon:yes stop_codon:yes gene_type:complete
MSAHNFEIPSRQSAKGIIVIFGVSIFKIFKAMIIIFAALVLKFLQSDKSPDFTSLKVVLPVLGIIVVFLLLAVFRYLNFKFYVKDDYFFLRKGIFNKEEISVSTSKIQNVYIKQNVLQQLINVVSLSIETAGDDKTEIEISALSRPKAEALKSILMLSSRANDVGKNVQVEEVIYFKASIKKLLLEGVSENHFKSFALIFAFIISIYQDLKEFVNQLNLTSRFGSWFELDGESFMALLLFNVTIVVALLISSFFLSMIRMFVQNFNLTVKRKTEGLEISKGLLNKINLSLSASRIQNSTISTNRLKRAFGLYKLAFTQAMANKKQQINFNIVGLGKLQINELLDQFYPDVQKRLLKNKPNKYLMHRLLFTSALVVVLLNAGLYFGPKTLLFINIPLVVYIIANALYAYKKAYYHLDDDYIVVGGGKLIDTSTDFLEIKKVQAVTLNQSIFQKSRGLASVVIFSASKPLTIPHIELSMAFNIKNYLLFKVESENKDWM